MDMHGYQISLINKSKPFYCEDYSKEEDELPNREFQINVSGENGETNKL